MNTISHLCLRIFRSHWPKIHINKLRNYVVINGCSWTKYKPIGIQLYLANDKILVLTVTLQTIIGKRYIQTAILRRVFYSPTSFFTTLTLCHSIFLKGFPYNLFSSWITKDVPYTNFTRCLQSLVVPHLKFVNHKGFMP